MRHVLFVHNMPYMNQAVGSDPMSSWQVRHKGKMIKALMGASAAYAGDHVELSDGGSDFASTVGIGGGRVHQVHLAARSESGSELLLTQQKEAEWRRWIALYNEKRLPKGAISAVSTISASTSPKPMSSRRTAGSTTPSTPIAGTARSSCADLAPGAIR